MRECYCFMSLQAANGFAGQSSSLHTSFYFTARWLLYCSATAAVADGDRESFALLSQRIIKQNPQQKENINRILFPQPDCAETHNRTFLLK